MGLPHILHLLHCIDWSLTPHDLELIHKFFSFLQGLITLRVAAKWCVLVLVPLHQHFQVIPQYHVLELHIDLDSRGTS